MIYIVQTKIIRGRTLLSNSVRPYRSDTALTPSQLKSFVVANLPHTSVYQINEELLYLGNKLLEEESPISQTSGIELNLIVD